VQSIGNIKEIEFIYKCKKFVSYNFPFFLKRNIVENFLSNKHRDPVDKTWNIEFCQS